MKCLQCEGTQFKKKKLRFSPEVKGEEVQVIVVAYVCAACEMPVMDAPQMNKLRRSAADEYRRQHGLLTSEEIIKFRSALGMSQIAFAKYLKVGEASIKRWETYFVQDPVQDEHIRLKCDETYAEFNALKVQWKSHLPDKYNGKRKFSWELFKHAVLYLIDATQTPLFLNKALFYLDFLHYKKFGQGITGARYVPLDYGPCPDQYSSLFRMLIEKGIVKSDGKHRLKGVCKPDLTLFDDQERETLAIIHSLAKKDGGKELFELSHQEKAFQMTPSWKFMSYDQAKHLQIQ